MISPQMLQLTLAYSLKPRHRSLEQPETGSSQCTMADGTIVASNGAGDIVFAKYPSGIRVLRNQKSVLVNASDGSYWYGDQRGCWYRLD